MLDCCFSGHLPGVLHDMAIDGNLSDEGPEVFVHASSGPTERAYESMFEGSRASVFAAAVVRGLRTGAADLDGDGLVHLDELHQYLQDNLSNGVDQSQSPTLFSPSGSRFLLAHRAPTWSVETRGYGDRPPTMQMDSTDWGKEIDIAAPPADQVAELPES